MKYQYLVNLEKQFFVQEIDKEHSERIEIKTGREWYYKIQKILQKPMRVQGKMKWFDDRILEKAQEWQGLTPLAEGHEMKVTSHLLIICHALDRERESVFEKEGNRMRERNSQLRARNWIRGI